MKKQQLSKRESLYVELNPRARAALNIIKERDGIPIRAQLERAIVLWAETKGIKVSL